LFFDVDEVSQRSAADLELPKRTALDVFS